MPTATMIREDVSGKAGWGSTVSDIWLDRVGSMKTTDEYAFAQSGKLISVFEISKGAMSG